MNNGNIKVVCPVCDNSMEIPGERKNSRIECSKCGNGFVAYEAVRCESCGKFRHPNHPCRNCGSSRYRKMGDVLWSQYCRAAELERKQREFEEQKVRELFDRLPEDIRTVLEFEAKKNAGQFEDMAQRIEELESRISELEDEIEELKDKEE